MHYIIPGRSGGAACKHCRTVLLVLLLISGVSGAVAQSQIGSIVSDEGVSHWKADVQPSGGEPIPATYAQLFRLYRGAMGRLPDIEGYKWWLGQISQGHHDIHSVARAFSHSPEFRSLADTDGDGSVSGTELLIQLYDASFDSEPAADSLRSWVDDIQSGRRSVADVLFTITQSSEHVELAIDDLVTYPPFHRCFVLRNAGDCADIAHSGSVDSDSGGTADSDSGNAAGVSAKPDAAAVLAYVQILDDSKGAAGGARPITFGVPVASGELSFTDTVELVDESGNVMSTQWNPLANWAGDGSVLHGVLSAEVVEGGRYSIQRAASVDASMQSSGNNVQPIGWDQLVASNLDASITVRTNGAVYRIGLQELLAVPGTARQRYLHFSGPIAGEFAIGAPLLEVNSGRPVSGLQGYFHLRVYGQPIERARVTFVLENTGAFHALKDIQGYVELSMNGSPVHSKAAAIIGADKRYAYQAWWGEDPAWWVRHDTEALQDTGLVPEYREFALADSFLEQLPRSVDWNGRGQLTAALDAGGAAPHLAPYDRWTAAYLVSADRRAYDAMMAHADAYQWVVSKHNYAMRPRDENTGFPLDLSRYPQAIGHGWQGPNALQASRESVLPMKTDMAHQPACAYVPYLLTADFHRLEQCQLWAVANWLMERPGSRQGWPRPFYQGQVRGLAWGLRNIVNAAVITPESHPLKQTLHESVGFALSSLGEELPRLTELGLAATGPGIATAISYPAASTPSPTDVGRTGIAPWMDDFLTWSIGAVVEKGYQAPELLAWKARPVLRRMGVDSGYCWNRAPVYSLSVMPSEQSPIYNTWSGVFNANFPNDGSCPRIGGTFAGGDRSATDYAAYMAAALSAANVARLTGVGAAWRFYDRRDTTHWVRSFNVAPEWAVQLRNSSYDGVNLFTPERMAILPKDAPKPPAPVTDPTEPGSGGGVGGDPGHTPSPPPPVAATDLDGNGVPDAIDAIPLNTWRPISINTLADVDPCPERNCPYSAVSGQMAVVQEWTGGAFAAELGALGSLIYWGGGHNGYYGNEIYVFDISSLSWIRRGNPTVGRDPNNPRDFGLDPATCLYHDGSPVAHHTYDTLTFDSATLRLYLMGVFDAPAPPPGIDSYCSSPVPLFYDFTNDTWGAGRAPSPIAAHMSASAWDPNRELIWIQGTTGSNVLAAYDPQADHWTEVVRSSGWQSVDINAEIDPMRDLFVIADFREAEGIHVWDLAENNKVRATVSTTGDTEIEHKHAAGIVWVQSLDAFLVWHAGADYYLLKPPSAASNWREADWVWTRIRSNGAPPSDPRNGVYSKVQYVPRLGILIVATDRDRPVYALRVVEQPLP